MDLYNTRSQIDALAILRPTIVGLIGEAFNLIRERFLSEAQTLQVQVFIYYY